MYDKKYDSELVQELITMNINFFDYANNTDREVFLDAALDSIKNITKTSDGYDIETELCNINIKNHKYYLYLPEKENVLVRIINDKSGIKIFNAVSYYFYKEEKNKNRIINKMLEKDKEISK